MIDKAYIEWRKYAPYNNPDIKEFYSIIDDIQNNKKFTIVRLADGEYSCLIDNQSLQDLLNKDTINIYVNVLKEFIQLKSLTNNENLLLGFEIDTPSFNKYKQYLTPIIEKLDKIYSSSIFSYASVIHEFPKLFDVLLEKNVLLVGPQYLNQFYSISRGRYGFKTTKHVVTPTEKVWEHQQEIENKIEDYIKTNSDLVIIYACSITAKIAALKFYKKYKNKITQVDVGATLDPYFKKINRPWHEFLIQEICG